MLFLELHWFLQSGLTGTLGNTLGRENVSFCQRRLKLIRFPVCVDVFFNPLQACLLAQPERVQHLARLRLRPDRLPAPRHGGFQSLPLILPESQNATSWLSGRPL